MRELLEHLSAGCSQDIPQHDGRWLSFGKSMISKTTLTELHDAMHECLDLVLDHASGLPPGLIATEIPGFGHPTVLNQIAHVLATERGWICGLQLQPCVLPDASGLTSINGLRKFRMETLDATVAYIHSLDDMELNTELDRYPDGWIGPRRAPAYILFHIVTHAFHHKGQIVAMFRLLGHPAPDTDMQRA
jgi:uncharacterized damage-inducible protein DinB